MNKSKRIAIIGLGYVGLPLAMEFAKHFPVIGFDINKKRVTELKEGLDHIFEVNIKELKKLLKQPAHHFKKGLYFSSNPADLHKANIFIVTVPTPIDRYNSPNLVPLLTASEMIGKVLKQNDIVIYESTVYPGCTEEVMCAGIGKSFRTAV